MIKNQLSMSFTKSGKQDTSSKFQNFKDNLQFHDFLSDFDFEMRMGYIFFCENANKFIL